MRDDSIAEAKDVLGDNIIFGPKYDAQVTLHYGSYDIEVLIASVGNNGSWEVISRVVTGMLWNFRQSANSPCTQTPSQCRWKVSAPNNR